MGKEREHQAQSSSETANDHDQAPSKKRQPTTEEVDRLTSSGEMVKTAWTINYTKMPGKKDAPLKARTPDSALYVEEVKVSPEGEPGKDDPEPHRFHGVAKARTGEAPLGSFVHPKGRAGKVSASVGYGTKKPRFDFTVETKSRRDKEIDKRQHATMVKELEVSLRNDKFVEEVEAQAELDRVVKEYFGDGDVVATIKPLISNDVAIVNTTDLKYASVNADRTFRLRVAMPSASTNRTLSSVTTSGGETTTSREQAESTGVENETSLSTSTETQRAQTVENLVSTSIDHLAEKVRRTEWENDQSWQHVGGKDTTTGSSFSLKNAIKGTVGLGGGLLGRLASKIIDATLNLDVNTELGTTSSVKINENSIVGGQTGFKTTADERDSFAQKLTTQVKNMMTTSLKSDIATAIRTKNSSGTAEKQGDGRKDVQNSTYSTTVGRIETVAADVQPHLEEE